MGKVVCREIRVLCTRAPQLADRIRDFRFDRIAKIVANDAPVPLIDNHALIMHVVPLSAFDAGVSLQLDVSQHPQQLFTAFPLPAGEVGYFRINVDGFLVLSNVQADAKTYRAYVQIFHNGIVEPLPPHFSWETGRPVASFASRRCERRPASFNFRTPILNHWARDAVPPYLLLVSLVGVKDIPYSFSMGNSLFEDESGILDRDQFHFSEMLIESVSRDRYEYAKLIRPLLDQTANAAGRARSSSFDHTGQFKLRV